MEMKIVLTLAITLLSQCPESVVSHNVISSILQDIMSPANTEKAMQLINLFATRTNKNIGNDCYLPRTNEFPAPGSLLANTGLARTDPVIIASDIGLPRMFVTSDGTRFLSESRINSEYMYPQKVFRQVESPAFSSNMVDLKQIYQAGVMQPKENIGCPCRASVPSSYLPVATSTKSYLSDPTPTFNSGLPAATPTRSYLPMATPTSNYGLPVASPANSGLPVATPNPFLSATPSLMPPSPLPPPTQSKGQFIKKIPMPPPMM